MKIYTKTGDDGTTGLVGGSRIRKDDPRMEAIGAVDELNASLGVVLASNVHEDLATIILIAQSRLFDIGAELATPADSKFNNSAITDSDVAVLEESIDTLTAQLPQLRNFILPGGTEGASRIHLARTVCRRAEREVLRLAPAPRGEVVRYLNRLSDWLFVAARTSNARSNVEDVKWTSRGNT